MYSSRKRRRIKQRSSNLVDKTDSEVHINCRRRCTDKKDIKWCPFSLFFFFFKQTSVVYIGGKVNYCSCNFLMWLLKYWRIVSRKPGAFSEKVKKKLKELQFKLDLVFLAKVLHFVSTQQYLQWSLKDFEVNSNFLIKFAKLLF